MVEFGMGRWMVVMGVAARLAGAEPAEKRVEPNTPPPAGQEASYAWYAKQYPDPNMFTLIGPPGDPGDAAVSAAGELFSAASTDINLQGMWPRWVAPEAGVRYIKGGLGFALLEEGQVVPLGSGERAEQSAAEGYQPVVTTDWKHGALKIRQIAFAEPLRAKEIMADNQRTLAWATFVVVNAGAAEEELTLLAFYTGEEKNLRPKLEMRDGVVFDGTEALFSARADRGFAVSFAPVVPAGRDPAAGEETLKFLSSRSGVFNALVVRGRLGAGQKAQIEVNRIFAPGQNINWAVTPEAPAVTARELTERSFEAGVSRATSDWQRLVKQRSPIETPDATLNDIYRKGLLDGLILTKRWEGRYIVYDSVIYRCQWDNPAMAWVYTLDVMGDHETAGKLLEVVFARQGQRKPGGMRTREGCFTDVTNITKDGSPASWASCNGWALWAMAEHARLTNDRAWLEKHKKQIVEGCEWILRERAYSREKADNPCAGLLYGKFVCDLPAGSGVEEAGYFTYTDAISFMGLNEMARLMVERGWPEGQRLVEEAEKYRADILAAMDRLTDKSSDPWYVPWVLSAPKYQQRYFHDIVGPLNLAYSCGSGGVVPPEHELIDHTIRWIVDRVHKGSIEHVVAGHEPPTLNRGAAFYSQDLALALLERGKVEEFLRMFYAVLAAGISHGTLTTTEWGDNTQPHIHSISSVVRMLRTMLVAERGGALYLLQGTPRAWMEQGKGISLREMPTWYGPVSLVSESDVEHGVVAVDLKMPPRIGETLVRLRLRLPGGMKVEKATANGKDVAVRDGEWVEMRGWEGEVRVEVKVGQ